LMTTIELEHAIGFSATIPNVLNLSGNSLIYPAGGNVVISDMNDPHNQTFLRGHDDKITCLTTSPRFIASGQIGTNSDVIVWNQESKEIVYRLREHDHGVSCVAFSHDEKLLVTVGDHFDRNIFVWDMASGCIVSNSQFPAGTAQTASISSPAHGLTGRRGRPPPPSSTATSHTANSASVRHAPSAADGDIVAVAWGGHQRDIKRRPTQNYIFCTAGPVVTLWTLDPIQGTLTQNRFQAGSNVRLFTSVCFSPDGERCFVGTQSGDFAVFLVRTLVLEALVPACSGGLRVLSPTPDGGVITGGGDGTVKRFRMGTRGFVSDKITQLADGHCPVSSVALPPGGELTSFVACLDDGQVFRIPANDFRHSLLRVGHSGAVTSVAFPSGNSERFATCSPEDDTVRVWDLSNYDAISRCQVPRAHPLCLAWAGECLAVGYTTGELRFIDAADGRVLWTLMDAHRDGVTAIAVTRNGRFIITGGEGGEVRVWELRTRELVAHLKEHTQRVTGIVIFEDDQHILSCSKDRSFLCWDLKQQRRVSSHHHRIAMTAIGLFPDQHRALTTGLDRAITFWDMSVPDAVRTIPDAHGDHVTCAHLAHEQPIFATGGADQKLRLWNLDGSLLCEGPGHSSAVNALRFSPDDRQLVSVGEDGTVLVWNVF